MNNSPITIVGRLVEQPDYHFTKDASNGVLRFRVAASRSFLKGESWQNFDQLYLNVEAWGRLGVNAHRSLKHGTAVIIQGMLYTNNWEAKIPEGVDPALARRQEVRLRASSIGVDMNYYRVGFKDARPQVEVNPDGVDIPAAESASYPDLNPRQRPPAEAEQPADAGEPELVGVGAGTAAEGDGGGTQGEAVPF